MKEIYLPKLKNIKIENFSLYENEPTFQFTFQNGISAIIGVNGIGKTTLVEAVLYSLLGHKKEYKIKKYKRKSTLEIIKINQNFFSSRFSTSYPLNDNATVSLEYVINTNEIIIKRNLGKDIIESLSINGEIYNNPSEEIYEEIILKYTQLSNFESLQTIVRNFLFFDEMRENVAWKVDTQDEILRILFFDEDLLKKFNELEQQVVSLDSAARHLSEDRRIFRKKLGELLTEKNELKIGEDDSVPQVFLDLNEAKNNLDIEITEIRVDLDEHLLSFRQKEKELNREIGERNKVSQQIEKINTDIAQLEVKMYSSIYDNLPDYYLSIERSMLNDNKCLVCGTHDRNMKSIVMEHKENKKCLVCASPLLDEENFSSEIIDELNRLNLSKQKLSNMLLNKNNEIKEINLVLERINNEMNEFSEKLEELSRKLMHVESKLAEQNGEKLTDMFSEIVKARTSKINELNITIKETYKLKGEANIKMRALHNRFSKEISKLNKEVSSYFNKYASIFLGLKCELTIRNENLNNNQIPHTIYLPKINGIDRENIWSVSESQRFFLDQAFRMAIIDYLQSVNPGFQTFFITETPEGSLDVAYEEQVAKMFLMFAQSTNNIIFTSNLNSSRFLHKLFKEMNSEEKRSRTLNLLTKGKLTDVHREHMKAIDDVVEYIFGRETL